MKERITKFLNLLRGHKIYIQTHNFPDPDAVASAFGLQVFLKHFGIPSSICYVGNIDRTSLCRMIALLHIEFVTKEDLDKNMTETDYIITVDGQKYNTNLTDLIGDEVACIDHHPTVVPCEYHYKDVRIVGACSTLICEYFKVMEVPMDQATATALLFGLKVDTDNLSRGVTQEDINAFSYLYHLADLSIITQLDTSTMELPDLKAYGAAIENIHLYGFVGYASIPFDCPDALIAMVSDFILSLKEVRFCVVYSFRPNGLKFSVRSSVYDTKNAGVIANQALKAIGGNGGGHAAMAGGFLPIGVLEATGISKDHWAGIIEDAFQKALE